MVMKLLIVESPSKAKTIEKYLEGEYKVRASVGHIRDLPKSNKQAIDIPGGFIPHYEISKGKDKVVDELRGLAEKAKEIILATDPDREGEAISWHLEQLLKKDKKVKAPISRVAFHEITKEAVQEALQHPRDIDIKLVRAQEARRVLDRLVGYDLSGIIWKKVRYGLSAGRVQSPALRLIMEREREIRAFIPVTYFVLEADLEIVPGTKSSATKKEKVTFTCSEQPDNAKEATRILEAGQTNPWHVIDVKETEAKRTPKAPFTTSTLQQTASSRLGFSPKRTMQVAQKLYEAGHISYMRTDSTTLSAQSVAQIKTQVEKMYGKQYLEVRTFKTKVKNAQEAHEAIRPTHFEKTNAGMNDEQKKLYNLIWSRTVASQMTDAKILRTKITANIDIKSGTSKNSTASGTKPIPDFGANGSRVLFDGWLRADPDARGEDVELPKVVANDPLNLLDMRSLEKQTEPPARYSEAALVKALEERGIGRPSTYASIISTLEDRGYVEKIARALKPTDTGEVVSSFLEENFGSYISDTFTAELEGQLDDIANGDRQYEKTLKDFYGPFQKELKEKDKLAKATNLGDADEKFKCPKCDSPMVIKLGRGGKFLSCATYPDCDGALTLEGLEIKSDEPIGNDPTTGLPIFVKTGRFGPYVQLGIMVKGPKKRVSKKAAAKAAQKIAPKMNERTGKMEASRAGAEDEALAAATAALAADTNAPAGTVVGKPRMASIPKEKNPTEVTVEEAMLYLSLPRVLGTHPDSGKEILANKGRFGPYVMHDGDFRSLKKDDVFEVTLERALEILSEPKKPRGFARKADKKDSK
jgi:DNA topoisomerase-1